MQIPHVFSGTVRTLKVRRYACATTFTFVSVSGINSTSLSPSLGDVKDLNTTTYAYVIGCIQRLRGTPIMEVTRLQRPPIFSAVMLSPNDPVFLLIVSAVTQRPNIFWWNVGFLIALTQRPPIFAFGCHRKLLFVSISSTNWSFLPFLTICFLQIPAFKALTERFKVTFSPNAP